MKNTKNEKSILVVGSVALDSVETPFGKVEDALGGSATYFSVAASNFSPVRLVAIVGEDFPNEYLQFLLKKKIDLTGLQKISGKTFKWKGRYGYDLNNAQTLETQLNVFESFRPKIPEKFRNSSCVFLANIDPDLQLSVLEQVDSPHIVACDTMNYWIERKPKSLKKVLSKVDVALINESEARQLTSEYNLVKAARKILALGPKSVVIKRGEYGVIAFMKDSMFSLPAYPLEEVFDPTGAGDTFAGGFMGFLASADDLTRKNLRKAIVYGSVLASFDVEDFSLRRIMKLTLPEIECRFRNFAQMTDF